MHPQLFFSLIKMLIPFFSYSSPSKPDHSTVSQTTLKTSNTQFSGFNFPRPAKTAGMNLLAVDVRGRVLAPKILSFWVECNAFLPYRVFVKIKTLTGGRKRLK
jgi:hypothetical protein